MYKENSYSRTSIFEHNGMKNIFKKITLNMTMIFKMLFICKLWKYFVAEEPWFLSGLHCDEISAHFEC